MKLTSSKELIFRMQWIHQICKKRICDLYVRKSFDDNFSTKLFKQKHSFIHLDPDFFVRITIVALKVFNSL